MGCTEGGEEDHGRCDRRVHDHSHDPVRGRDHRHPDHDHDPWAGLARDQWSRQIDRQSAEWRSRGGATGDGEDGGAVRHCIAKNDVDGVKPFVYAVEELSGEIHFSDGVVDVGETGGEELHATSISGDREIPLFEIAVLPIEGHVPGAAIGEEVVADVPPEIEGGGGANYVIDEGISQGGVDPENKVGIEFMEMSIGVGREGLFNEVGDAVTEKNKEEEGLPLMIVLVVRV
ncbi:hypothetical protein D1007_18380 [Hordeum vulgare]|nr:hypothetical protein D1007_18380 [Hordeum vulgare]